VAVERLDSGEGAVLPLVEEALRVGKRRVETGRVRISVATEAEERIVRETLRGERAEVERVAIDRELALGEAPPVARHEADGTYVLPVLEEVLVVERRLVLREEIRMRLVTTEEPVEEVVTLRPPARRGRAGAALSEAGRKATPERLQDPARRSRDT
jgi:stress response protein YsnF